MMIRSPSEADTDMYYTTNAGVSTFTLNTHTPEETQSLHTGIIITLNTARSVTDSLTVCVLQMSLLKEDFSVLV